MISETISDDGETSEKHDHEDQPMSLSINDIKTYVYTFNMHVSENRKLGLYKVLFQERILLCMCLT